MVRLASAVLVVVIAASTAWAEDGSDEVAACMRALKGDDAQQRLEAASALGALGAKAGAAVPSLIAALEDDSFLVRFIAADALGKIGAEPKTVVPALARLLQDEEASVRLSAVRALRAFPSDLKPALSALVRAVEDSDSSVRGLARWRLEEIGGPAYSAVPTLLRAMVDAGMRDQAERSAVLNTIWVIMERAQGGGAPDTPGLASILAAFEGPDAHLRGAAAEVLAHLGCESARVLEFALAVVGDVEEDIVLRISAIHALGYLQEDAKGARFSALRAATRAPSARAREAAVRALGNSRPLSDAAVLIVAARLGDDAAPVRLVAAQKLVLADVRIEECVAVLAELLSSRSKMVRAAALIALGSLGSRASGAIPALEALGKEGDPPSQSEVGKTLEKIRGD